MIHNNNKKTGIHQQLSLATCYNRVKFVFPSTRDWDSVEGACVPADGVLSLTISPFSLSLLLSVHLGIRLLNFLPCLSFSLARPLLQRALHQGRTHVCFIINFLFNVVDGHTHTSFSVSWIYKLTLQITITREGGRMEGVREGEGQGREGVGVKSPNITQNGNSLSHTVKVTNLL